MAMSYTDITRGEISSDVTPLSNRGERAGLCHFFSTGGAATASGS